MPVDHHGGTPGIQQGTETLEAPVRHILLVPEAADRRVGEQDIKTAGVPQHPPVRSDAGGHFLFGIHMGPVRPVADRSAEAENPDAFDLDYRAFRTQAAFRGFLLITVIMITVHIDDRRVGKTGQEGQILCRQVPCGQDDIHVPECIPAELSPEPGRGLVRNSQNPHTVLSLSVPAES